MEGLGGPASALSVAADLSCAILDSGRVACWGDDDFGQLGRGGQPNHPAPGLVGPWETERIRDANGDGRIVVACLGDSNTQPTPQHPVKWCDELAALFRDPSWSTVNRALAGASATRGLRSGQQQLDYTLANDAPDAVIVAFGSNDLLHGVEPARIVEAYAAMRRRTLATGASFLVALAPLAEGSVRRISPGVAELNGLLRSTFAERERIDAWASLPAKDFADKIHLNASGHARIARAAWAALMGKPASEAEP